MRKVATHLLSYAAESKNDVEQDEFGRSSFNRFYYATFLVVRSMLAEICSEWSEPAHKSVPQILRKSLIDKFKRCRRNGVLSQSEKKRLISVVSTAASNLASLMEEGSGTRVVADYQPQVKILKTGSVFELNGTKSSRAAIWPEEAERNCKVILREGKRLEIF